MSMPPTDTYFRTGLYPSPKPEILGKEGAGRVVAIGPDVERFSISDRVVWMAAGGYAEYSTARVNQTMKIPDSVSSADACAVFLQGLTAITLVEESYAVKKGDWILVTAASGGVGGCLLQILRTKHAHVIATVGSESKMKLARENGAEVVLLEGRDDVLQVVKDQTGGQGVAAVFDGVGKTTFNRSLACVARKGSLVSYGNASGAVEPFAIS